MTRLFNDPDDFAEEMIEGFAAASARWVRPVTGGVVRSTRGAEPTVAVVIGGGSGHYPAFGGLVGPGLAHGAAMGNLFASPSAHQVHAVATAAHEGRGVLLSFGNYAGDVLHFGQAQERMRAAGIDCRTVLVTDDVWSAPKDELDRRRGIAGDLVVFKIAGAAAEAGHDLDDVERLARLANARTRSFGVAFGGCTLPGADEPLFDVPAGRMAVGLGIHGEPGIDEVDVPTAAGLAEMFVTKLLDELPEGVDPAGARVVPILNGLGSVKYEELFVVYRTIHTLLTDAGVEIVSPEVGEFCTSFDMAGASLTLLWLDDELERLWLAPCDTPAFRRGEVAGRRAVEDAELTALDDAQEIGAASDASRAAAAVISRAFAAVAAMLDAHADELGRIDRIAGDGDHGIGMQRGSRAAAEAAAGAAEAGRRCPHDAAARGRRLGGQGRRHLGRHLGRDARRARRGRGRRRRGDRGCRGRGGRSHEGRRHVVRQGQAGRQDDDRRDRAVLRRPHRATRRRRHPDRRVVARRRRRHRRRGGDVRAHRATGPRPVARRQEPRHPRPGRGLVRPGRTYCSGRSEGGRLTWHFDW